MASKKIATTTATTITTHDNKNSRTVSIIWLLSLLTLTTVNVATTTASQDVLPHPCDVVPCPHVSEIICPEDSAVRDTLRPLAMLHAITAAPTYEASSSSSVTPSASPNTTDIAEELYAQCCLAKKCLCKTCYVPNCSDEGEVVVEVLPESMETPGRCCGQYECRPEPNCTEVRDTDSYWRANCQRCKCYSGERICHQSCDEGSMKKTTPICKSKNLNRFFEQGKIWRDGCYECECVNGAEKCVIAFCRSVNCPLERQVMLKDHCCPICWPEGNPMPNTDGTSDDYADANADEDEAAAANAAGLLPDTEEGDDDDNHIYDDDESDDVSVGDSKPIHDDHIDTLPNISFEHDDEQTSATPMAADTATETEKPIAVAAPTTNSSAAPLATGFSSSSTDGNVAQPLSESETATGVSPTPSDADVVAVPELESVKGAAAFAPCQLNERQNTPPATYQVYPEVVEVVRPNHQNDVLYSIIIVLTLAVIALAIWNRRLRNKQHSYTTVSNVDDNFNKMPSKIKKKNNEFV